MAAVDRDTRDAERILESMFPRLDPRVDGWLLERLAHLGFGMRGRDLYLSLRRLVDRSHFNAAVAVERSLLDRAILTRWIEVNPGLHLRMWLGDDASQSRLTIEALGELRKSRGWEGPAISESELDEKRELETNARSEALAAGEPIKKSSGPVLPDVTRMVEAAPELSEARFAYRVLSPMVHAGGRSFTGDEVIRDTSGAERLRPGAPLALLPFGRWRCRSLACYWRALAVNAD